MYFNMYNLEYWIGINKIETILFNKPKTLCIWKRNQLKKTHSQGQFKIIEL